MPSRRSRYTPRPIDIVIGRFPIAGADVVDLGSGSGRSALPLAEHARSVVGVEPEPAMLAVAERAATARGVTNVRFVLGTSQRLPVPDESADVATAFTSPGEIGEAMRVLRPGGVFVTLDIAPGWYGGDLAGVIGIETPEREQESRALVEAGFAYEDVDSIQDYGATEAMIATYGFIFGKRAIDHIRETGRTTARWRFRIHWKHKDRSSG